uniref:Golgin subfamily A conserved domain-containing protein n=1 Tax=Gorilla gorilla gorilla TaxID=9595 RepID=G3S3G6_GORGO
MRVFCINCKVTVGACSSHEYHCSSFPPFTDYHQWNSAGVGTGATDTKKKKINNGTNPQTTTSGGCHSPEDSSVFLFLQEKKASHQHQEALRREIEAQDHTIRILMCQKTELETALYYSQDAARKFEDGNLGTPSSFNLALSQAFRGSPLGCVSTSLIPGESKDLAGRLHHSWHFAGELQRAVSAVSTWHKKADRYIEELTKERDALSLELYRNTITNEELKKKNAELQEKLRLAESEKSEIQLNVKELKRKLERDKILLPQVQTNTLQEEMWRQEEELREQEKKIRKQEEKMWRQEQRLRDQEGKMMREQEKMWEQEKKMQEQEEKMRDQKMWGQEEKMIREQKENMQERLPEHEERCSEPCLPPSKVLCNMSHTGSVEPAGGEAGEGSPQDNPTAQIMQLLPGMKNAQERPGLGSNSCIPFFYRGDKKKMKIINI